LAPQRGQHRVGPLRRQDPLGRLDRERLDVGAVGPLRVRHDGGRIGVQQDGPVPLLAQRLERLHAGVVEFAGLPDDDGTGGELEAAVEEEVEVALLLYPEFEGDLRSFEEFRDEVRKGLRLFYCVAFHPDLPIDLSDENRAVSFLRRSPDPTLQLVRVTTLDRVRSGRPAGSIYVDPSKLSYDELRSLQSTQTVSEQIARANLRTLQRHAPTPL